MEVYSWFMFLLIIIVFLYTIGFAYLLWQEKTYTGAIIVSILAISTLIIPFAFQL